MKPCAREDSGSPTDPNAADFRRQMRRLTHDAHVRLNRHPLLAGITKPGFPLSQYGHVLTTYYHLYKSVECAIEGFIAQNDITFDYARRRKLPWIEADLLALKIDPGVEPFAGATQISAIEITSLPQLIGTLYPLEGATLGGQVISGHLVATAGLTANSGARFFNGYGSATEQRWTEFWTFSEASCPHPSNQELAGHTALDLFLCVEGLLDNSFTRIQV